MSIRVYDENVSLNFNERLKFLKKYRDDIFVDKMLPKLQSKYKVVISDSSRYIIHTDNGIIDYYSKANKILIRKENKWIKPGLQWIIHNL
jgi:hypothetical protein